MNEKHFQAILAKNHIARELQRYVDSEDEKELNVGFVLDCLKTIEDFTGEANQPSVQDLFNDMTGRL